jgi:hypothetical protein
MSALRAPAPSSNIAGAWARSVILISGGGFIGFTGIARRAGFRTAIFVERVTALLVRSYVSLIVDEFAALTWDLCVPT